MTIRAIATDLDGTLLRSDGTVSRRSVATLRRAEAAGILVVIATARPPRWVRPIVETLGPCGVAVCANGALVYDTATHRLVDAHEFPRGAVREIIGLLRNAFPPLTFGLEQGLVGRLEPEFLSLYTPIEEIDIGPLEQLLDRPTAKMLLGYRGDPPADLALRVRAVVGGLAEVSISLAEGFLDLTPPGIDKSLAVEAVVAGHGISAAEVVAFGDMPIDVELLRWAGLGVAVANAHPDVLAVADEVTASHDEDGVARVVERLLARKQQSFTM